MIVQKTVLLLWLFTVFVHCIEMNSITDFLDHVLQELHSDKKKVIVSGNDSADLDSIISSLLFAYLSQKKDSSKLYIPLVKVPQEDLELRPELKYVFDVVGLDYKKLVTIDGMDTSEKTDIVLIDHNHLTTPFGEWSDHVVGILDHHVDEKLYLDAPIRIIDMVGSCVTLVLNHFDRVEWNNDQQLMKLAMAPILVDTVNLKRELGRTTDLDVDIFDILSSQLVTSQDTNSYFKNIEKVKAQVDSMSNYDILRRDYKEFTNVNGYTVGTSAVTWNFNDWIKRETSADIISTAALDYAAKRKLDLHVIFTAFDHGREETRGGDYRRELAIFVVNKELKGVQQALETNQDLGLIPYFNNFYQQSNVKMSRKQVWPLIKSLIEQEKSQL